jgi:response regulator RpfG family c-di-GMP phosphodiesterase
MQEPNYLEIVAVPVLQRKCQELFNSNMILETNLHVELTKNRHLTEELAKIKSNLDSTSSKLVSDESVMRNALTQANARIADLDGQLALSKSRIFELEASLKASSKTVSKRPAVVESTKDDF